MAKQKIKDIEPYVTLYRDPDTGIAWVENGRAGTGHSCHPNIHHSGKIRGMKKLGYWRDDAVTVKSHGFIYNISQCVVSDELDQIALEHCQCDSCEQMRQALDNQ